MSQFEHTQTNILGDTTIDFFFGKLKTTSKLSQNIKNDA